MNGSLHLSQFFRQFLLEIVFVKEFFFQNVGHYIIDIDVHAACICRYVFSFRKREGIVKVFVGTFHSDNAENLAFRRNEWAA